jgi:hypothetical protein
MTFYVSKCDLRNPKMCSRQRQVISFFVVQRYAAEPLHARMANPHNMQLTSRDYRDVRLQVNPFVSLNARILPPHI